MHKKVKLWLNLIMDLVEFSFDTGRPLLLFPSFNT